MRKKVSIATMAIACLIVFLATYCLPGLVRSKEVSKSHVASSAPDCPISIEQIRTKSYNHIQPLILAGSMEQSSALRDLKGHLEEYINEAKAGQKAEEITVYFRKLNDGSWFCINPNQTYNPASMSKIIYLICFLKEAENNPAILNKKIFFARHFSEGNQPNIKDFVLPENREYAVKDLLTYMVKYSDNDATMLLSQNMKKHIFNQLFNDLNIPLPPDVGEYFISANDYSKFFRLLYNAAYVRPELSELGLQLLTMSTYEKGLRAGIDPNIEIAHKFGERIIGTKAQLHEFGIVFIKGDPFLIGIMSKGSSLDQLSPIISDIARIAYGDYMRKYHS